MTFTQAISTCFSKYFDAKGRATRPEYWYFYLFYIIVYVGVTLIGGDNLAVYVYLAFAFPLITAGVRRLHDVDKSGWFLLVPIYNVILLCTAGTPGPNRFGGQSVDTSNMAPPTPVV